MGDQRVVALAFTRNSSDVVDLINRLLGDPYFHQSADNIYQHNVGWTSCSCEDYNGFSMHGSTKEALWLC